MDSLDQTLSGTQELAPLGTHELELSGLEARGRGRRRWLLLGLVLVLPPFLGWLVGTLRQPPALPGPRNLRIRPGLEKLVVEFETAQEVPGALEIRPRESELPPRVQHGPAPTRSHRFLVELEPRTVFLLRALAAGERTLEQTVRAPPPLSLRASPDSFPPGAGGSLEILSRPPTRGTAELLLEGESAPLALEVGGEAGKERVELPAPAPGTRARWLRYRGEGADGTSVEKQIALLWGAPDALAAHWTQAAREAHRLFLEMLERPGENFQAAGVPLHRGAVRRPEAARWATAARSYFSLQEWLQENRHPLVDCLRGGPAHGPAYRVLARLTAIEEALGRDGDPPPSQLAREAARELVPPGDAEPPTGEVLTLLEESVRLLPNRSGLPGSFFGPRTHPALDLPVPRSARGGEVELELVGDALDPGFFFLVASGGHRLFLSSSLASVGEDPGPGRRRYRLRVPRGWLREALQVKVSAAPGSLFSSAVRLEAVRLHLLGET